jgi:hypothetical protein
MDRFLKKAHKATKAQEEEQVIQLATRTVRLCLDNGLYTTGKPIPKEQWTEKLIKDLCFDCKVEGWKATQNWFGIDSDIDVSNMNQDRLASAVVQRILYEFRTTA